MYSLNNAQKVQTKTDKKRRMIVSLLDHRQECFPVVLSGASG